MAMGLEADSLGIVDDVHELVVDHSDSSVGDARDAHEVAVSHSGSETFLEGLSSSLGDAPDAPPGKAPLERGISAIDLIEHELLAAAEADDKARAPTPDAHADMLHGRGVSAAFLVLLTMRCDLWEWKTWEVVQFRLCRC